MNLSDRKLGSQGEGAAADGWGAADLAAFEKAHPEGVTVHQVVEAITSRGDKLTEATFRKYVQLGLLPRSVRVGRKGKHRGSRGLYPVTTVRQLVHLRRLMAEGFTIEEIQKEFLFVRGEIEALSTQLGRVFDALDESIDQGRGDDVVRHALKEARGTSDELIKKLESIERRLSLKARMDRAVI